MQVRKFEDLKIWQSSKDFLVRLYCEINFKTIKDDYNLVHQIRRAGISIIANIAEGFERQTKKEFIQFLYIAKGSAGEVRSLLHLAKDLTYMSPIIFHDLNVEVMDLSRSIASLIRYLQREIQQGR